MCNIIIKIFCVGFIVSFFQASMVFAVIDESKISASDFDKVEALIDDMSYQLDPPNGEPNKANWNQLFNKFTYWILLISENKTLSNSDKNVLIGQMQANLTTFLKGLLKKGLSLTESTAFHSLLAGFNNHITCNKISNSDDKEKIIYKYYLPYAISNNFEDNAITFEQKFAMVALKQKSYLTVIGNKEMAHALEQTAFQILYRVKQLKESAQKGDEEKTIFWLGELGSYKQEIFPLAEMAAVIAIRHDRIDLLKILLEKYECLDEEKLMLAAYTCNNIPNCLLKTTNLSHKNSTQYLVENLVKIGDNEDLIYALHRNLFLMVRCAEKNEFSRYLFKVIFPFLNKVDILKRHGQHPMNDMFSLATACKNIHMVKALIEDSKMLPDITYLVDNFCESLIQKEYDLAAYFLEKMPTNVSRTTLKLDIAVAFDALKKHDLPELKNAFFDKYGMK